MEEFNTQEVTSSASLAEGEAQKNDRDTTEEITPVQEHFADSDDEAYHSADEEFFDTGSFIDSKKNTPRSSLQGVPSPKERIKGEFSTPSPLQNERSAEEDGNASAYPLSSSPQTPLEESEAVTVRDLDTGKQYVLEKVYRIKDLDTGKEFLVDGENSLESQSEIRSLVQVDNGKQLSMAEFERNIGLVSPILREVSRREGSTPQEEEKASGDKSSDDENEKGSANLGKKWMMKRLKKLKNKFGAGETEKANTSTSQEEEGRSDQTSQNNEMDYWQPGGTVGKQVKVTVQRKIYKEYTDVRIVQELTSHTGPVWRMRFSLDGQYLATGGQDEVVRVWSVLSPAEKAESNKQDCLPFLDTEPYRLFTGHKADILDLCWSKTQFLLSSSMDKTVRLWHTSMNECLRVFNHTDFVTSIQFNPVDDKYFISGSLDEKVRLWNIPEQTVIDWVNVHEMVTATCFSPDGKKAIVGSYKGKCRFYSVEGNQFEYITQIDVKNARGKNSRGKKITGLEYMPGVDRFLLITSNDSRIRMYDGYTLCCKYKGHRNANSQISSSFSPGGGFVACGSEDGCVFVWSTINTFIPSVNPFYTGYRKDKNASYESFTAHDDIVTEALFAPQNTRKSSNPAVNMAMMPPTKAAEALVQPSLKRLGLKNRVDQEREEAQKAGEAAVAAAAAVGQIIITAGYNGEIRIFENVGLPVWL